MKIKKSLERVHLTDTQIKLVMPEKVFQEIKYLCSKIAKKIYRSKSKIGRVPLNMPHLSNALIFLFQFLIESC